jgi:hypothetical protein
MTLAATILGIACPQLTTVSAVFFRSTEFGATMILKVPGRPVKA